jgi:DNA topoisomerase II
LIPRQPPHLRQLRRRRKLSAKISFPGNLLTSDNYDDSEKKTTGGRNGYGAKLANVFSHKFTVETANKNRKKKYTQSWTKNMTIKGEPVIENYSKDDFTR